MFLLSYSKPSIRFTSILKALQKILFYIKDYKGYLYLNIVFNLLSIFFSLFSFLMIVPFLQVLFEKTVEVAPIVRPIDFSSIGNLKDSLSTQIDYHMFEMIQAHGKLYVLGVICICVITVFFLKGFFRFLSLYYAAPLKKGVLKSFRRDYYDKLLHLPIRYYRKERKGDLISRFSNDLEGVENGIIHFLDSVIKEPLYLLFTLITLFFIHAKLTLIVSLTLPVAALIIGRIAKKLKTVSVDVQQKQSKMVGMVEETIYGIKAIQSFLAETFFRRKFKILNDAHYKKSITMNRRRDLSSPMSEVLGVSVVVLILWVGGKMVLVDKSIRPEIFIAFITIFSQAISPAKAFSNAYFFIQKGLASLERIESVIQTPIDEKAKAYNDVMLKGKISFDEVSFAYTNTDVLSGISFDIKAGEKVALVGKSGAGKSTIIELLAGFHQPKSGFIKYDDLEYDQLTTTNILNNIGLVSQETFLFSDTITNNITMGDKNADFDQVKSACKKARADVFIRNFGDGYAHVLGEHGGDLSGGERQRLAIARIFYKNPPILLMDEPTSSLDSESEAHIKQAMEELWENKTVIIIAHRLSTIQNVDRIFVIDEGKIVESGSYQELMKREAAFYNLVLHQQL